MAATQEAGRGADMLSRLGMLVFIVLPVVAVALGVAVAAILALVAFRGPLFRPHPRGSLTTAPTFAPASAARRIGTGLRGSTPWLTQRSPLFPPGS
jgi:hypothetical protein